MWEGKFCSRKNNIFKTKFSYLVANSLVKKKIYLPTYSALVLSYILPRATSLKSSRPGNSQTFLKTIKRIYFRQSFALKYVQVPTPQKFGIYVMVKSS
jgi:hypothetical protein